MDCSRTNNVNLFQQGDVATLEEHQKALAVLLCEFDRICRTQEIQYFLFAGTLLGAVRHQGFIPWDDDLDIIMLREDYERFLRVAPEVMDTEHFFLQKEFSDHWPMFFSKMRLNGSSCLEKHHPKDLQTHQGVYIDIFPCDNGYQSVLGRKIQFLCSKVVIAKGLDGRGYETDSVLKKAFMTLCRLLPNGVFHRIVRGPKKRSDWVHSFLGGASKFSKSVYPSSCFEKAVPAWFEGAQYPAPWQHDSLLTILYGDYMRIPAEEERKCKQHAILVDLKRSWEYYADYWNGMKFEVQIRSIR